MADLIDRQEAIYALYHIDEYNGRSVEAIKNLPSAQPERPKGKWIKKYLKRKKAKNILLIHHGGIVQSVEEDMSPH